MIVWNTMENDARVLNEARTLARAGHDVVVHALLQPGSTSEFENMEPGFVIHRSPRSPFSFVGSREVVGQLPKKRTPIDWVRLLISRFFAHVVIGKNIFQNRPDVIHAHDVNTLPTSWVLRGFTRSKLVYDAHEISTDREGYRALSSLIKRIEGFLMPRATTTITTTDMRADHFVNAYKIPRPLVIQNRPRIVSQTDSHVPSLRERLSISVSKPIVLYQGGLQQGRGLSRLIACATEVENADFVFIGGGRLAQPLRDQARELGVQNRVHFIDTLPHSELHGLTRSADIGVQPLENTCLNHETTDSNKLFEYMHAGLAVIASDLPEIRKVVTDADCGLLVRDSDTKALCNAIQTLVNDHERRKLFAANSIAASQKYSWEAQENVLLGIYSTLLGSGVSRKT